MTDHVITLVVVFPLIVTTLVAVVGDLCHAFRTDEPVESTQTLEMPVPRVEYRNSPEIAPVTISGSHTTSFEVAHRDDTDHDLPEVEMIRPYFAAYERGELSALRAAQAVAEDSHGRDVLVRVLSGLRRL